MKYVVDVDGARQIVTLNGGRVSIDDLDAAANVDEGDGSPVRVIRIGSEIHRIVVRPGDGPGRYALWVDGFRHEVHALDERTRAIQDLAAASAGPRGPAPVVAPMPGLIVRVTVSPGDQVVAGASVVVMEAMKMENELRAPAAGTVRAVHAAPGMAVEKGVVLVELE